MKKLILRRAVRIAADVLARNEMCIRENVRVCKDASDGVCARCIRDFLLRKAREELRTEGRL